jgi:hypothetical protein
MMVGVSIPRSGSDLKGGAWFSGVSSRRGELSSVGCVSFFLSSSSLGGELRKGGVVGCCMLISGEVGVWCLAASLDLGDLFGLGLLGKEGADLWEAVQIESG